MKLKIADLLQMQGITTKQFVELDTEYRLDGMTNRMSDGDRIALCYFKAALCIINRMGGLNQAWLEALEIDLHLPTSINAAEGYESAAASDD